MEILLNFRNVGSKQTKEDYDRQKIEGLKLYSSGCSIVEISKKLGTPTATIANWRDKFGWKKIASEKSLEQQIADRIKVLLELNEKTKPQIDELKTLLVCTDEKYAQRLEPKKFNQGQIDVIKNPKNNKIKKAKNSFKSVKAVDFEQKFKPLLTGYQARWREAKFLHAQGKLPRTRAILKSRQIGATWYFAAEAFEDAILTGNNQIFLSASQNQALIFRSYIREFSKDWFGVELKGTHTIELWNGAIIYFLATSSRTAQGYHGNVYMDEFFWMPNFNEFKKVAVGMAAHKKWRRTYFSTPSALSHEAYGLWSGARVKNSKNKENVDISKKHLKYGAVGSDRIWRMVTDINDAKEMGCNFFDIDELREEHSKAEFDNLFLCKFVDDSDSVFKLSKLQKGIVEIDSWNDFNPNSNQPFGQIPVWIGYDPALTIDDASVVVIAPPIYAGGKFRLLEKHRWKNETFGYQANRMKLLTQRYNVAKIAMDTTGSGYGAYENVKAFFPMAIPINYSTVIKEHMVAKMQDVINAERFEYQDDDAMIMSSFMAIGKSTTHGGKITVKAKRSVKTGHADVAWAIMNAVFQEPTNTKVSSNKSGWGQLIQ